MARAKKKPQSTPDEQPRPTSPVRTPARGIPAKVTLFLYVQAGGRCEFDGCNEYLLEHYPTETPGNFAEQAHIYAFNEGGSRGKTAGRPADINELSNLMLLCPQCHHLVDSVDPTSYPVPVLKKFKQDHEDRIYQLTGLSKDRDTVPVVFKALIAGRKPDVSDEEIQAAVAPNFAKRREKLEIDLTNVPDTHDAAFWKTCQAAIDARLPRLFDIKPRPGRTLRVSVFAMGPIPCLIYLGSRLSDKMHVDLYQRHRNPETWTWQEGTAKATYTTRRLLDGIKRRPVVLLVNLSGANALEQVPAALHDGLTLYELRLTSEEPNPAFLKCRDDLVAFTQEYVKGMAMIRNAHPGLTELHMLPAVPAPVAIAIGRTRLPKVDPPLVIHDRDARAGGFVATISLRD